jgi:GrpB-like predicted nucleotidyltransferase (UPF0157 family)
MVERGSDFWRDHPAFRDWLRDHPEDARGYERLKRDLAARLEDDREAYTDSKAAFIRSILEKARSTGYWGRAV